MHRMSLNHSIISEAPLMFSYNSILSLEFFLFQEVHFYIYFWNHKLFSPSMWFSFKEIYLSLIAVVSVHTSNHKIRISIRYFCLFVCFCPQFTIEINLSDKFSLCLHCISAETCFFLFYFSFCCTIRESTVCFLLWWISELCPILQLQCNSGT